MSRLVIGIKYFIFIRQSITAKMCLYVLPLQKYLSRLMTWLIEILVYRRIGSFSGFKKLGGIKRGIFIRK